MPLVVAYSTGGGTATPGVDYVAVAGANITFAPGSTSQNITLQLIGDTLLEDDESFGASFQLIFNGTVQSSATANITILDDEVGVHGSLWQGVCSPPSIPYTRLLPSPRCLSASHPPAN